MTREELKMHCEKQINLCSKLNNYKHLEEHQLILSLIEENARLNDKEIIGGNKMKSSIFINYAKNLVRDYANEHLDKSDDIPEFDVFVVWYAYELGHSKALLSTTLLDGMYYEITYNSNKNEIYVDAYKKFENKCIKLGGNKDE